MLLLSYLLLAIAFTTTSPVLSAPADSKQIAITKMDLCTAEEGMLTKNSTIKLSPNPPVCGKPVTVEVDATLTKELPGDALIVLSVGPFNINKKASELLKDTKLPFPLPKGCVKFKVKVDVPESPIKDLQGTIKVMNGAEEWLCRKVDLHLTSKQSLSGQVKSLFGKLFG